MKYDNETTKTNILMERMLNDVEDRVSIDHLIEQLEADSMDLDNSLENFVKLRNQAISSQKRALAKFAEEMIEIEESANITPAMEQQRKANIDHNIFKHLSLDILSEQIKRDDSSPENAVTQKGIDESRLNGYLIDHNSFVEKNKKFAEMNDHLPPPSFDQKKQVREEMFAFLDESTIEETRLEIEIEHARTKGDNNVADELADALYILQRINNQRLTNLIHEYRPQPGNRTWGGDPEYGHLSKQLFAVSEAYNTHETIEGVKRR